jgi:hypothetical protein
MAPAGVHRWIPQVLGVNETTPRLIDGTSGRQSRALTMETLTHASSILPWLHS